MRKPVGAESHHHLDGAQQQGIRRVRPASYFGLRRQPKTFQWFVHVSHLRNDLDLIRHYLPVAVTRAKALLIIIGDPNVLSLDPLWRSFLTYIHGNGGWTGQGDIPWDPLAPVREDGGYDRELRDLALANMNDFARRVEEFTLGEVAGDWEDVQEADANADRPWQEVE